MITEPNGHGESLLSSVNPSKAITRLAIPATLALIAKALYNIVDTAYIGMLGSETALAAVGVTLPLLLIFVSIENILAAGAAVLAGRQLGSDDRAGASITVSTIVAASAFIGLGLCITGIIFMEPLLRCFGASDSVMPLAKDYAFWMFIAAIANLPAQSLNCAARAESSVRMSSIAVISGALLNVVLDPIFMFRWGLNMGVEGASLATTVSQFVTLCILVSFYWGGNSIIKIKAKSIKPNIRLFKEVVLIGVPTAVIQICLAVATSLTNVALSTLPDSDLVIAAYGVVQRLVLIGCYIIMGLMQGYQPVASYSFGANNKKRFVESIRFAVKATITLSLVVASFYIVLSKPILSLFNHNPAVLQYGSRLLVSQMAIYPAFGLCYLMTITFQTIGSPRYGLFLSTIRQGLLYIPLIVVLPHIWGITGVYFAQPISDVLTLVVCLLSYKAMVKTAANNMAGTQIMGSDALQQEA